MGYWDIWILGYWDIWTGIFGQGDWETLRLRQVNFFGLASLFVQIIYGINGLVFVVIKYVLPHIFNFYTYQCVYTVERLSSSPYIYVIYAFGLLLTNHASLEALNLPKVCQHDGRHFTLFELGLLLKTTFGEMVKV